MDTLNTFLSLSSSSSTCIIASALSHWIDEATRRNASYAVTRRELLDSFNDSLIPRPEGPNIFVDTMLPFWSSRVMTVRTFLSSRDVGGRSSQTTANSTNQFTNASSDAVLAYTKALEDMRRAIARRQHITFVNADGVELTSNGSGVSENTLRNLFTLVEEQEEEGTEVEVQASLPSRLRCVVQATLNIPVTFTTFVTQAIVGQRWMVQNMNHITPMPIVDRGDFWQISEQLLRAFVRKTDGSIAQLASGSNSPTPSDFQSSAQLRIVLSQHEDGFIPPIVANVPNPHPATTALTLFDRYSRDDLTSTDPSGVAQRVQRIRADVRFIEEKLDVFWPILQTLLTRSSAVTPAGSSSNASAVTFPNPLPVPQPPLPQDQLGTGGYPMTLEGQLARLLFNFKQASPSLGFTFQSTLSGLTPKEVWERRADLNGLVWQNAPASVSAVPLVVRPGSAILGLPSQPDCNAHTVVMINPRNVNAVIRNDGHDGLTVYSGLMNFTPSSVSTSIPATMPGIALALQSVLFNTRECSKSLGVIPQASLDGTATMTIADVAQVLEPAKKQVAADPKISERLNEIDSWTVQNILSRPTLIASQTLESIDRDQTLFQAQFPNQWLNNLGKNTHFNNMLSAFTMMRANVVFRLVANTTPMYGGIIAMGFDFFGRLHEVSPFTAATNKKLDLVTVSSCDPVYLDLSLGTVVEMSVPFSAVSQYLSRQHAPFSSQFMGTVFAHTMTTIFKPTTTSPNVELRLFAYVEMPEVAVLQEPDTRQFVVPQASLVKTITSFAHSFLPGMATVYPLALDSGYHVKRENTCRVEEIGSVYGLIATKQWTTTTNDKLLFSVPVHPMAHQVQTVSSKSVILAPKIAHLGRHFCYWNGTLEYKIEVGCSASHAGKLYVVFESGPDYQGAAESIETNAHILLDVQTQHSLEFSIPFSSPTPWKPTYMYQPFGDIALCSTGSIKIYSADPIKSALSANSDITVNLYVRAGSDFQYSVSGNGLEGESRFTKTIAQVSLTSLHPRLKMNSEDFNDLYKILRRYTPLGSGIRATGFFTPEGRPARQQYQCVVIPVRPLIPRATFENSISVLTAGFSFWRGSLSYKFKLLDCTANRAAFEVFHIPNMGIPEGMGAHYFQLTNDVEDFKRASSGSFYGSQTFHADIDKEWEVTVPYYSMYDHLHIPTKHHDGGVNFKAKYPLLSTNNGCLIIRPLNGRDDNTPRLFSLSVSISCGEDFTLLAPTAYPPIIMPQDKLRGSITVVAQASMPGSFPGDPLPLPNAEDQGFFDFFSDIGKTMSNLENLSRVLNNDVNEDSKDYIASIMEETMRRLVNRAKIATSGWLQQMVPDVDWKLLTSALIASCVLYKFRKDTSLVGKLIVGSLTTMVSHKVLEKLQVFVSEYMGFQTSAQVGSGFDIALITQLCCGSLAVLLNMDMKKGLSGLIKNLGDLGKNLSGMKTGAEAIKYFSHFISENIIPSLGDSDQLTMKSIMCESKEILEEVFVLNLDEMRTACFTQSEMKQRVLKCYGRLHELQMLCLSDPRAATPAIMHTMTRAMTRMEKLKTEVMCYKGEDGYRQDPFHVSVYGPPKIGKSAMMNKVSDDLIMYHGLPTTNKVYTRSPENVYWDNYKGQTTVMFDDLGQIAAQGPPSDLSELIALKSNAPYMVHMASMAEKGTYFTSDFIISSTNFKLYNDCTYVKSKDALHRRRDVLVEMDAKVKGHDGLMPSSEFTRGLHGTDAYCQFRILNSVTATPETEWMTYDELIVDIVKRSEQHRIAQKAQVDRNLKKTQVSSVIQAMITERDGHLPVIVDEKGDVHIVDADAQGLLDSLPVEEAANLMNRWKEHFKNALYWFDYGALTSGFSPLARHKIASAILSASADPNFEVREGLDDDELYPAEAFVVRLWMKSQHAQRRSAKVLEDARSGINAVGAYFNAMWERVPKDQRKMLATALVSMGALAIGTSLYVLWSRSVDGSEESNIPINIFSEGDYAYHTKQRGQPNSTKTVTESSLLKKERICAESGKIDDYISRRGGRKVTVESGKDDYKTFRGARRVQIEGAEEYKVWASANPNMIPYPGTQMWEDYKEFCDEIGHANMWSIPESSPGYVAPAPRKPWKAAEKATFIAKIFARIAKEVAIFGTFYYAGTLLGQATNLGIGAFTKAGRRNFAIMFEYIITVIEADRRDRRDNPECYAEGGIEEDEYHLDAWIERMRPYIKSIKKDENSPAEDEKFALFADTIRKYCKKHNLSPEDFDVVPESGKDDYKTFRGARKVIVEGAAMNPMLRDVPPEYFTMTEEELMSEMTKVQERGAKHFEKIETDTACYDIANAEAQFTNDDQCVQLIRGRLVDNVGYIMHMKSGYRMRCLIVNDRFMVLPKHFFLLKAANWQQADEFRIWVRGKLYSQSFHQRNLLQWAQRDLCMYLLSARITGATSVVKFIADRSTHGSYRPTDGSLLSLAAEKDGSVFFDRHHLPLVSRMTEADHERIQYPVGNALHILKGFSYSADTVNGDCGSVLLQHNIRQPQKIMGLHVAAQTGITRAFSELLIQEEVIDKMNELTARTDYYTTGSVLQTVELMKKHNVLVQGAISHQFMNLNENIDILGAVPKNMIKRTPEKTEIRPSPIADHIDIQVKTEPAILSIKDARNLAGKDPLIVAVGGYGLESKPFRLDHLDLIREHQANKFKKYSGFINKRVLSLNEAINGIPGVEYADSMNMNSAEGSFWNLDRPCWAHNKSWMFDNKAAEGERADYRINRESGLLEKIIHRLKEAMAGRRVLSTSNECLKDERRGFNKTRPPVDATEEEKANFTPGTRSFTILPVDYNILIRQYFWDFAAMIMKNRGELAAQVGIDPCSVEWTGLMKRLLATSNRGFAGDFKQYDRQTQAEIMKLACDVINDWYDDGPVNAQIRHVLMGEAYDHCSILRDAFIHIAQGLPSGFPLTVIVNCLNNDTYKYLSWLALAPPKLVTLDCCDEHTDSMYYGDDNGHAIDPVASPFFNLRTVGEFLEGHGVSLTDEHKNHWSKCEPLVPMESVSFLKRLFVKHPDNGLYLAPLEKKSIEDRLLWVTDSKFMTPDELVSENITNSLRDAFMWGPGYFLELKNKIDAALTKVYPDPEYRRRMLSDVTYGGEEYRWIQTCKYMDQMDSNPILRDVFGF